MTAISASDMWKKGDAKKLIDGVWEGEFSDTDLPLHLFRHTANELTEAFEAGWGKKMMTDPDIYAPDLQLAQSFQRNLWYFSGNKSVKQVQELQSLMFDAETGERRSRYDFVKDALKVDETFNAHHLATEYDMAFRRARAARKWANLWAQRDVFKYVRFVTAKDDNVRRSHAKLHGITKRIEDSWWDTHRPPLDWRCRCDFEGVMVGSETPTQTDMPETTPAFKGNMLEDYKVFVNEEHPYGQNITEEQQAEIDRVVDIHIRKSPAHTIRTAKGLLTVSLFHGRSETADNVKTGLILANKEGHKVEYRAAVDGADDNYDAYLNARRAEMKAPQSFTAQAIKRDIKKANSQGAEIVVIRLDGHMPPDTLINAIQGAFGPKADGSLMNSGITEIWLIIRGHIIKSERRLSDDFKAKVHRYLKNTEGSPK